MVGHLHDPGAHCSPGRIEDGAVAMDVEKYILEQIVSFGIVAQNAHRNSPYETSVATEQDGQRFPAAFTNPDHQRFVRDLRFNRLRRDWRGSVLVTLFGDCKRGQTKCSGSVHETRSL